MSPDLPSEDRADEPVVESHHDDRSGSDSEQYDPAEQWDANDPRRRNDPFAPPTEPCECYCLHCQRTFMSDEIWLQRIVGRPEGEQGYEGHWLCPTPNCSGVGFLFDIYPTDPNHPANAGWVEDDDDEAEDFEHEFDDFDDPEAGAESADYDPGETKWKKLDEDLGDSDDDDIEGEEWKYGLEPGELPPPSFRSDESRREWEEEQRQYDEPDRRAREVPWEPRWSHRKGDGSSEITEDDIPF